MHFFNVFGIFWILWFKWNCIFDTNLFSFVFNLKVFRRFLGNSTSKIQLINLRKKRSINFDNLWKLICERLGRLTWLASFHIGALLWRISFLFFLFVSNNASFFSASVTWIWKENQFLKIIKDVMRYLMFCILIWLCFPLPSNFLYFKIWVLEWSRTN